ncbi:MAG: response regulator transcription factor [Candidatus Zixiibacteriota bacterium]
MMKKLIRTIIVDDQQLVRQGLVCLFEQLEDFEVVGDFTDGQQAIEQVTVLNPDVAIIDTQLHGLDGISTGRRMRIVSPKTEIVYLTSLHSEDQMREAFESSGRAYLLKSCSFEELAFAARKASCGDYYLSGPASQDMVAEYVKPLLNSQKPGGLVTQREREIARLLADGYSTKEAADILNISPKTVETHRASIMKKLNAKNVTDIVKYCIRNHILEA